jgi:pyruvate/2-oxoglutarate/acetoin dehydrogenase E1 component
MARSGTAPAKGAQTRGDSTLRVTAADVPLQYSRPLEDYVLPRTADIVLALRRLAAC